METNEVHMLEVVNVVNETLNTPTISKSWARHFATPDRENSYNYYSFCHQKAILETKVTSQVNYMKCIHFFGTQVVKSLFGITGLHRRKPTPIHATALTV